MNVYIQLFSAIYIICIYITGISLQTIDEIAQSSSHKVLAGINGGMYDIRKEGEEGRRGGE